MPLTLGLTLQLPQRPQLFFGTKDTQKEMAIIPTPQKPLAYELTRHIRDAQGGAVYLGRDKITNEKAVVKQLYALRQNRMLMRILVNEINVHRYISNQPDFCSHIAKLLQATGDMEELSLVIELGEGGDLVHYIEQNLLLEGESKGTSMRREQMAKKYFRQLITAVQWLHSKDVCHRDLSLDNLVLDLENNLKVIDFGTAFKYAEGTRQTPLRYPCGKPLYMSPEVFAQQPYDGFKTDIWSCGVILFTLLFAGPPFEAPHPDDNRFQLVINGQVSKLVEAWGIQDKASSQAVDLVSQILRPEAERPSFDDILRHPWLQSDDSIVFEPLNK